MEESFRNVTVEDVKTREFHIEMNADYAYFANLTEKINHLPKEDKLIAHQIEGVNIDLINLQWIYRAKVNYTLSDEEVLNYTLKGGNKLTFGKMKELIYSQDFKESFNDFINKKYPGLQRNDFIFNPRAMHRFFMTELRKLAKEKPMSIAPLMEFMYIMEFEHRNLITVVEGAKYKTDDRWEYIIPTFGKIDREGR